MRQPKAGDFIEMLKATILHKKGACYRIERIDVDIVIFGSASCPTAFYVPLDQQGVMWRLCYDGEVMIDNIPASKPVAPSSPSTSKGFIGSKKLPYDPDVDDIDDYRGY